MKLNQIADRPGSRKNRVRIGRGIGSGVGKTGANVDAAKAVGKLVAERAAEKGVTDVVFDRGRYLYHGRVKALAAAAREAGLKF